MIDKIGKYIIKESVRYDSIDRSEDLPVYGVSNVEGITETQHKRSADLSKYLVIRKGNFAYNPYRINVGSIGLTGQDKEGLVSPAYVVFRTDENKLLPELLFDFLKSDEGLKQINKYARGTVRKALRFEDLAQIEMPIPDIGTQNKILEKKKSFDKNIRKLLDSNRVQANELQELRQQILQDAISGKLSEQWRKENPNVESAEVLLEKIKAEKEILINEGKIRKQKELPPIKEDEIPFELPNRWVWCRLGEILTKLTDGAHQTPSYVDEGIPFLSVKDISSGVIDFSDTKFITEEEHDLLFSRCNPEYGDLLLTKVGTTGIAKVVDTTREFSLFVSVALLKFNQELVFNFFLESLINSPLVKKQSEEGTKGMGNQNLVLSKINDFIVPLPPYTEQKHVVIQIESLFKRLDQIKYLNIQNKESVDQLNQVVLKEMFEK